MNGRERFERQRSIPIGLLICGLFCLLSASSTAAPEQGGDKSAKVKNPFGRDKEAIEAGQQHFQAGCAFCHGTRGAGGRGPFLSESNRVRSLSDEKLFDLLRHGIPGTPMPPSSLDDTRMWQLVAFLRSLHFTASQENVPGDPGSGKALFSGSGCSSCHMLKGLGGLVGPDLSDIGGSRSLEKLREAIVKPDASVVPGFRSISVHTRGGQQLSGVARNHSNYGSSGKWGGGTWFGAFRIPNLVPRSLVNIVGCSSRGRGNCGKLRAISNWASKPVIRSFPSAVRTVEKQLRALASSPPELLVFPRFA